MFDMTEEDVIEFINDFEPDDEFEAMLQYERIGLSEEEIDNDKTSLSYECIIYRYWYFKVVRFKFESNTCNKCSDGCIFSKAKKKKEILNVKGFDVCILSSISRNKSILNNSVLEDGDFL